MDVEETLQTGAPTMAGSKEWIALAVLALPTLLVSMDTTVVYLALPSISAALKPGSSQQLWITDIYGFMEAGLLITMGTLGDRIGRRKLLLIGAVAFAIASAISAFSKDAGLLIAARGLLGVAGSTLLPSTLSMVRNMFHNEAQRTFAIGLWTTCFSTGTMLGPLVGGFLLSHFWWGSVFLMGVPVMVLFLILGPLLLPEFKDPGKSSLDLWSVLLLIISILPIVFGIKQIAEYGMEFIFVLPVIIGLALGVVFFRRQMKLAEPLIDLNLFRIPRFGIAMTTLPVCLFMWAGIFVFVGQYLQLVIGLSPFKAGLWTLPAAVFSTVMCMCAALLAKAIRKNVLIVGGLVTMAIGLALLTRINNNLPVFLIATVLLSAGCGLVVTLSTDMVMTSAPPDKAGTAAGVSETNTTLGASFGIALLGSIGMAVYRNSMAGITVNGIGQKTLSIAQTTLGAAVKVSDQLHNQAGRRLADLAQAAFIQSFRVTAGIAVIFILIITVVVAILFSRLKRRGLNHQLANAQAPSKL